MKTRRGSGRGGRSASERKPKGLKSSTSQKTTRTASKSKQPKISTVLKNGKNKFSYLPQASKSEPGPSKKVITVDTDLWDSNNDNNGRPRSSQAAEFVPHTYLVMDEDTKEEEEHTVKDLSDTDKENILRSFDLDPTYGPCRGISRMERLQRVYRYRFLPGPPSLVAPILRKSYHNPRFNTSVWDQSLGF